MNCSIPSTSASPSLSYKLNSISLYLCTSSSSLHHRQICVALLHLTICLCQNNLASGMRIPHWLHCRIGVGCSFIIAVLDFQCMYMKCSLSLNGLCALSVHPYTGYTTDFNTCDNDTTYVSVTTPPTSTPRVCVMNNPLDLSVWWRSENAATVSPHSSQIALFIYLYLNVPPSTSAFCRYAASPCCPQMNPGVQTIILCLSRVFL